jgi:hypothetical protein
MAALSGLPGGTGATDASFTGGAVGDPPGAGTSTSTGTGAGAAERGLWTIDAFLDLGYAGSSETPANRQWRGRGTTPRLDEPQLNMAGLGIAKAATPGSPWGMEFLAHAGRDALAFGFHTGQPEVEHADLLRHLGRANVSLHLPGDRGLRVQAGLFGSLVGYESLYSRDNRHYTRSWIADYSPYLMFGLNASLPLGERLTATAFLVNGFFHLAHANAAPGYGAQLAFRPSARWNLRETVYWGPEQAVTDLEHWRFFLDSVLEWQTETLRVALGHQAGTERLAHPGGPRAFWTGGTLSAHWQFAGPWSVGLRPEFFWDPDGLLTGARQLVRAVTATLGYRLSGDATGAGAILRLEYRHDASTGPEGGFFTRRDPVTGEIGLAAGQHLAIASVVLTFDPP